jgi:subtilase-type serine protease
MKTVNPCADAKNHKRVPRVSSWPCLGWLVCLGPFLTACGGGGGGLIASSATNSSYLNQTFTGSATLFNSDDQEFKNVSTSGSVHPFTLSKVETAYQKGLSGQGQTIVVVDSYFDASASFSDANIALRAFPELQAKFNDASTGGIRWNPNNPIEQGSPQELPHGNIVASIAAAPNNNTLGAEFYCSVTLDDSNQSSCYPESNSKPELNHGIQGVAFNAGLFLIDYEPSSFSLNSLSDDITAATSSAAKVMNNSWGISLAQGSYRNNDVVTVGSNAPSGMSIDAASTWLESKTRLTSSSWKKYLSTLKTFQQSGVVIFALQNNSDARSASITAALPQVYPELRGAWIAVGNIETSTQQQQRVISRRGASCLETAEYCLVADGTGLRGAGYRDIPNGANSQNGLYRDVNIDGNLLSGTSLAAPQVSGMIALLAEAFPNHTPAQLATRLLASANNRFMVNNGSQIQQVSTSGTTDFGNGVSHAYSEEFGHGIPDMAAALAPIGTAVIPTTATTLTAASNVPLATTFISPSKAFGDGIERSLSNLSVAMYDGLYGGFKVPLRTLNRSRSPGHGLKLGVNGTTTGIVTETFNSHLGLFSDVSLSINTSLHRSMAAQSLVQRATPRQDNRVAFRFNRLSQDLPFVDDDQDLRLDFSGNDFSIGGFFKQPSNNTHEENNYLTQGISGYKNFIAKEDLYLGLAAGYQLEQESFRNGVAGGALSVGPATSSWFLSPQLQYSGQSIYFEAAAVLSVSSTSLERNERSLIRKFSPYTTSGWRATVGTRDLWAARDHLFARLWQPERVESGVMEIDLPTLVSINQQVAFSRHKLGLEPSGREVNLSIGYDYPLGRTATLTVEGSLSKDPGHIRRDTLGHSILTGLNVTF